MKLKKEREMRTKVSKKKTKRLYVCIWKSAYAERKREREREMRNTAS